MAITERYVKTDAAGGGDGTTEGTALTFAEMVTEINAGSAAGYRYNIKSGTYDQSAGNVVLTGDGTRVSPIILRGYNSTPGDLDIHGASGRTNGNGDLIDTNFPVFTLAERNFGVSGTEYVVIQNISMIGTGNLFSGSQSTCCYRCKFSISGSVANIGAINISGQYFDCDIFSTATDSGSKAVAMVSSNMMLYACHIKSATNGVYGSGNRWGTAIIDCQFVDIGGIAINFDAFTYTVYTTIVYGNTIQSAGGGAIKLPNVAMGVPIPIINNHITDTTGWAVLSGYSATSDTCAFAAFNRTRDNSSGKYTGFTDWATATSFGDVTTDNGDASSDFVSAPTDLRLVSGAPGRFAGIPAYRSIGALQINPDFPAVGNVQDDDTVDGATGTLTLPAVEDVENGVTYGAGGTEFTGTLVAGSSSSSNKFIVLQK